MSLSLAIRGKSIINGGFLTCLSRAKNALSLAHSIQRIMIGQAYSFGFNCDLFAYVFPRLAPAANSLFRLLIGSIDCLVCCDWPWSFARYLATWRLRQILKKASEVKIEKSNNKILKKSKNIKANGFWLTRYKYLHVSLKKKLSILSSLVLSITLCKVAYPHLAIMKKTNQTFKYNKELWTQNSVGSRSKIFFKLRQNK